MVILMVRKEEVQWIIHTTQFENLTLIVTNSVLHFLLSPEMCPLPNIQTRCQAHFEDDLV